MPGRRIKLKVRANHRDVFMHRLFGEQRFQTAAPATLPLEEGYYEFANGWNDRALYIGVHYAPASRLQIDIYVDYSKPLADLGISISLGANSARVMSLIGGGNPAWSHQDEGLATLLGNCAITFLQAIYSPRALLTGWAPPTDDVADLHGSRVAARRRHFWARFGVVLDEYNMFDVKIGDLVAVDSSKLCLGYFPCLLPLGAFRRVGGEIRDFPLGRTAGLQGNGLAPNRQPLKASD